MNNRLVQRDVAYQEVRDAFVMFVQQRCNTRLAQIQVYQQCFVAYQSVNTGKVGRKIGLAVARFGRGNQHGYRGFALRYRFEAGAYAAQRFGEGRFGALNGEHRVFVVFLGVPDATDQREIAYRFGDVFFAANRKVQQFAQYNECCRY